jgi:nucleotide-binding universal stress UspA family protein
MPVNYELETAIPDTDGPPRSDAPRPLRILVPVGLPGQSGKALAVAAQLSASAGGILLLTHVRIFDPPAPGCPGVFCAETVDAAAALLDDALLTAWAAGAVGATTAVVDAARAYVARAIARQAASWGAGMIVMTRRPRPAISCLLLGSDLPDQVMRAAQCPVLAVPTEGRFSRHARG